MKFSEVAVNIAKIMGDASLMRKWWKCIHFNMELLSSDDRKFVLEISSPITIAPETGVVDTIINLTPSKIDVKLSSFYVFRDRKQNVLWLKLLFLICMTLYKNYI